VVILVLLLAYLGYLGYAGSDRLVDAPSPSHDCRTPAIAEGWTYEAINYDASTDAALADEPDPANCARQGAPAGGNVSDDGIQLAGWYIPAGSGIGPQGPTVILAHRYEGNKSTMLAHAALLHEDYNLILFDFRNHGQSGGDQTTQGMREQDDVRAMVDWLERRKGPQQIAVLGVSMGGASVLAEAVSDERIDAVILDSTQATASGAVQAILQREGYPLALPGSWAVLLGTLLRTGEDISAVDPLEQVAQLASPLLIIEGGRDDAVGPTAGQDLEAAAKAADRDARLAVCASAGHAQSLEACPGDYRDWVLGFLSRSLAH